MLHEPLRHEDVKLRREDRSADTEYLHSNQVHSQLSLSADIRISSSLHVIVVQVKTAIVREQLVLRSVSKLNGFIYYFCTH